MGHLRERYNEKGRQSKRPAKRINVSETKGDELDPNAAIVEPKSKEQKEADRRERLKQELIVQTETKFTSKRKKRLEKYITKKLKKEERVEILEKLAVTQAQLSSSVLQSSATLGSRVGLTHKEIKEINEDRAVRKKLKGQQRLYGPVGPSSGADSGDDDADFDDGMDIDTTHLESLKPYRSEISTLPVPGSSRDSPVVVIEDKHETENTPKDFNVGSGLKRTQDGSVQAPVVMKRRKNFEKTSFKRWTKQSKAAVMTEESKDSFDSSDSASSGDDGDGESNSIDSQNENSASSDEGSDDDVEKEETEEKAKPSESGTKRKRTGFKGWALQQLSAAKTYVGGPEDLSESANVASSYQSQPKQTAASKKRSTEMRGPLGEDLQLPENMLAKYIQDRSATKEKESKEQPTKFVRVTRPSEVQEARLQLPIIAEEQPIIEAIRLNPVVVICGETGSGKTTQVPQFLYEAGFGCPDSENPGMIGITQPRRVAAISMASRVAQELSLPASRVSYQIRYDATTSPTTSIKFMTDGVLLRELATDFTLSKYSVIIVDEAHERSVNTDILIGVLSRVVKLRQDLWKEGKDGARPLRLIIMSATLRIEDFVENAVLFPIPPPVIKVVSRQYPVTIHFSRRTVPDYIEDAIKKTCKIHTRLPPGGVLIFMTGQNEIVGVCRKLEGKYGAKAIEMRRKRRSFAKSRSDRALNNETASQEPLAKPVASSLADIEIEEMELGDFNNADHITGDDEAPISLDPEALDSDDESNNAELGIDTEDSEVPMHVLPLYSLLPNEKQMHVFKPPPPGTRLVVVATNVAETSLTIPGIRYVVDCGRAKERCYDVSTGVQSFRINWISKASANQRAGRAGRTGPGHCYRLFSSALFEHHFQTFASPEILQMPIEGIVLQMKSMHIDTVINFPFPTPPDRLRLSKAEKLLVNLGALEASGAASKTIDGHITELGKAMALFPLSPRFSKMLVSGQQHGCLPYAIAIVAALSVGDPFIHEEALAQASTDITWKVDEDDLNSQDEEGDEGVRTRRRAYFKSLERHSRLGAASSDVFRLLSVVGAYEFAGGGVQFCQEHFVRPKAMEEIHKLRSQISNIVATNFPRASFSVSDSLRPPSELQIKVLKQLLCSSFIDQVAVRKDKISSDGAGNKYSTARGVPYRALGLDQDAFIHPSSVLYHQNPSEYLIYQEIVFSGKLWMKTLTVINPTWLALIAKNTPLCTFSRPMKNSSGKLMVIPKYGPEDWQLPAIRADQISN